MKKRAKANKISRLKDFFKKILLLPVLGKKNKKKTKKNYHTLNKDVIVKVKTKNFKFSSEKKQKKCVTISTNSSPKNTNLETSNFISHNWQTLKEKFLESREGYFDAKSIDILSAFEIIEGVILFYFVKSTSAIGAALLDKNNLEKILWRSANPIYTIEDNYIPKNICLLNRDILIDLYNKKLKNKKLIKIKISLDLLLHKLHINPDLKIKPQAPVTNKSDINPIIKPTENLWENSATFNCAALCLENNIHLVYRAIGNTGLSVLGYAKSSDGLYIKERLNTPIYNPLQFYKYNKVVDHKIIIDYCSGGGYGGCEDPRLTLIDDTIYMTYTAFDGAEPPGVALTAIKQKDFLKFNWQWREPILISPRRQLHKNWVLFPEKISGKFAILHSISPTIQIDYFDNLDFETSPQIYSNFSVIERDHCWDNYWRGVGPPPIKTEDGWLVLYHAMDKREPHKYKLGAMMLDYSDPTKVLYRSINPILEPVNNYEWYGNKGGVVYSCGAVIFQDKLFIYYGAADTVTCAATAEIKEFLQKLKSCRFVKNRVIESLVTIIE